METVRRGASEGLPPRARGSRVLQRLFLRHVRPTPACAGITNQDLAPPRRRRAYPRVRGDHFRNRSAPGDMLGLPPRARGSRLLDQQPVPLQRPTPACAGITTARAGSRASTTAYPRVRGDHSLAVYSAVVYTGLPPRARGSRGLHRQVVKSEGPTPACAGITLAGITGSPPRRAYPRVRGDHMLPRSDCPWYVGLPPRARGSPLVCLWPPTWCGPTPACAGITSGTSAASWSTGPTPACAGITMSTSAAMRYAAAYPRVRGDHIGVPVLCPGWWGLPPRARGSLRRNPR